jgi:hypothetical protein
VKAWDRALVSARALELVMEQEWERELGLVLDSDLAKDSGSDLETPAEKRQSLFGNQSQRRRSFGKVL